MTNGTTKDDRFEAMRAFARRWLVLQWRSLDKALPIPCLNDREVDTLAGLFEECAERARTEERERCANIAQDCAENDTAYAVKYSDEARKYACYAYRAHFIVERIRSSSS